MIWNPTYRLQHKHRNASSERSPNHRKANYDLDQFTEENSKNPSLNSTLGCLKVVDTFRNAFASCMCRGVRQSASKTRGEPTDCVRHHAVPRKSGFLPPPEM